MLPLSTYAQEEFLGKGGGISANYEHINVSDKLNANTFGVGVLTNRRFSLSASVSSINEVVYPTFILGYISKAKEDKNYGRIYIGIGPSFIQSNMYLGAYANSIVLINSQSNYPTSITGALGVMTTFNTVENGSNTNATIGAGLKQALGAKNKFTPVFGLGVSYNLTQTINNDPNDIFLSFSIAFNINM